MQHQREAESGVRHANWAEQIPDDEWALYQRVIAAARGQGLRFALGGAFALASYTGHWRNTKDLDLYILPEARDEIVALLSKLGLGDYYEQLSYDRGWIYRSHLDGTIIDAIWAMANRRAQVDALWLERGPVMDLRGERVRVIPAEELLWGKLYVFQRQRCDWTDVLNLIYAEGPRFDWAHLLTRVAEDARLLGGVLSTFAWLCPGRAAALPAWIWEPLGLAQPEAAVREDVGPDAAPELASNTDDDLGLGAGLGLTPAGAPDVDLRRVDLLDTRPWFHARSGMSR